MEWSHSQSHSVCSHTNNSTSLCSRGGACVRDNVRWTLTFNNPHLEMFVFRKICEKETSFQAAVRDCECWIPFNITMVTSFRRNSVLQVFLLWKCGNLATTFCKNERIKHDTFWKRYTFEYDINCNIYWNNFLKDCMIFCGGEGIFQL